MASLTFDRDLLIYYYTIYTILYYILYLMADHLRSNHYKHPQKIKDVVTCRRLIILYTIYYTISIKKIPHAITRVVLMLLELSKV
jgi:hypothetical protein